MPANNPYRILITAISALLLLIPACERELDNPWDEKANLNPNDWAPQNFQVEDVSITEKKLTWTYDGDDRIEGFKLDRKIGDEPWQVDYQTFSKETRSWNDTDIVPDPALTYSYRLYTYAGKNVSSEKNSSASAEFPAPTNLQIEKLSDISYKLTWQDNSTGEEGFKIDRKTGNNDWVIAYGKVGENTSVFVDTNVFVGKSSIDVEYRVYAFYQEFESAKTDASTNAALTPPTNLIINPNTITAVTLNWQINSTGEEGFKIERRYEGGDWEVIADTTSNYYQDSNFELNTLVYYRVSAYVGQYQSSPVESSFSSQIPAPSNLELEKLSDVSYKLTWQDNTIGEQGFRIDRKTGEDHWVIGYGEVGENINTFTDSNVFLEKTTLPVSYRVYAFYENYASEPITASTNAALTPPSNLTITQNSIISVTLNWQDNSTGEDGFKIERQHEGGSWNEIATTTSNSYNDNTFELNTQVYYRVSAYVGQYQSSFAENNFNSQIPAPVNLNFNVNSNTSVTLSWEYSATGHEGFKLERKTNEGEWNTIAPNINPEVFTFTNNQINLEQNNYAYQLSAFVLNTFSDHAIINIIGEPCAGVTPPPGYGVVSSSGKCWLDRNLGASRVAQSSTDAEAYGDLYQWGRLTDGHQNRTSPTTTTLSNGDEPGHDNFITVNSSPYDWRSPQNNNLWQGVSGTNNPCPSGYRLPTEAEWEAERQSWSSNNSAGAFNSPLKLPVAGYRFLSNGSLDDVGSVGYYWSATVDGTLARSLLFGSSDALMGSGLRAFGLSVRCLKE